MPSKVLHRIKLDRWNLVQNIAENKEYKRQFNHPASCLPGPLWAPSGAAAVYCHIYLLINCMLIWQAAGMLLSCVVRRYGCTVLNWWFIRRSAFKWIQLIEFIIHLWGEKLSVEQSFRKDVIKTQRKKWSSDIKYFTDYIWIPAVKKCIAFTRWIKFSCNSFGFLFLWYFRAQLNTSHTEIIHCRPSNVTPSTWYKIICSSPSQLNYFPNYLSWIN